VSDPKPPEHLSPKQMRELADRLEREAHAQLARAKQLRGAAETIERLREMRPLETSGLPLDADDATIRQPMQAQKTHPEEKRRPGRKFSGGPFAVASKNSGKSMTEIAKDIDEPLGTVKAWNALHRNPPDGIRERMAKKPYFVPSSAWKP
jgi:hypothetical protein